MGSEGQTTLQDCCKLIYRYPSFYGMERHQSGVPVIRGEHLLDSGQISEAWEDYWFVSEEFSDGFPKTKLEKHDIVMAVRGTVGKFSKVTDAHVGAQISPNTIRISPDPGKVYPEYLFHALKSPSTKHFLEGTVATSAVPGLKASDIKLTPLDLPPLPEQKAIAHILGALDDKIELNRRMNATLEGMAQALFKSWFVDFDPVIDNAILAGNPIPEEFAERTKVRRKILEQNKNDDGGLPEMAKQCSVMHDELAALPNDELGMLNAECSEIQNSSLKTHHSPQAHPLTEVRRKILGERSSSCVSSSMDGAGAPSLPDPKSLFPAAFEFNDDLGWIPEGWTAKQMGQMLRSVSDTYPLKTVDEVVFLNTGDILDGKFLHADYSAPGGLPGQAKKSIQKHDILYSEIRPRNRRFAYVHFDGAQHVVSTKLMVLRATSEISSLFTYLILKQDSTIDHLQMLAESRSGTFPQITFDVLAGIQVALPPNLKLVELFTDKVLKSMQEKQLQLDASTETLTKLRDTLLPRLISGDLTLSHYNHEGMAK